MDKAWQNTAHKTLIQSNDKPLPFTYGIDGGVAALLQGVHPRPPVALKTFLTYCTMAIIPKISTLPLSIKTSMPWTTEIQPFSTSRMPRQMPPSTSANISQHLLWRFAWSLLQTSSLSLCNSRPTLAPTTSTFNFTWEQPSCNVCLTLLPLQLLSSERELSTSPSSDTDLTCPTLRLLWQVTPHYVLSLSIVFFFFFLSHVLWLLLSILSNCDLVI